MAQRILNNLLRIESGVERLSSYVAGGDAHVLLTGPAYRGYRVQGVRLSDWVETLAAGKALADVSCVDEARGCAQAPE